MKKGLPLLFLLCASALSAQQQADQYYDPAAMAAARERLMHHHGENLNYLVLGERLESRSTNGDSGMSWEAQGWIGTDLDKLWLNTEGDYDGEENEAEEAELQILYSRAVNPWWDFQAGLRHDFRPGPSRDHAVIGFQGLAPYWFEIDAAAFLSEDGDVGARLEAEYDLRLSQRLILQPRLELNYALDDDPERGIGQGLHGTGLGLRLRYEIRREFAPYVGLSWQRAFGETADLLRGAGEDAGEFSIVAGIRFWY